MKYFAIGPNDHPTAVERALMWMVENYEAFPHTTKDRKGKEIHFYKILT